MQQSAVAEAFGAKVRRGMFRPVNRFLPAHVAEDRVQEAICLTYEEFVRYAKRGVVLDDALLVHSCRLRATDAGRRFVKNGGQPKRDVLDPRHQLDRRFEVLSLDWLLTDDDRDIAAATFQHNPTKDILSALSLEEWLASLDERDQMLLALRLAGFTLGEIGDELGLSVSNVFQRLQRLGRELAEHAGIPLAKRARKRTHS